jgi:hypothetical protein
MEKRLLDRVEDLAGKIDQIDSRLNGHSGPFASKAASTRVDAPKTRKPARKKTKAEAV